jgi:hypothetical protein
MGRKGDEDVLPEFLCQVHLLAARELDLTCKVAHFDGEIEGFQTVYTLHPKRAPEGARGKQAAFAQSHVQRVGEGRDGLHIGFVQTKNGGGVFSLHMFAFVGNLKEVNLHGDF